MRTPGESPDQTGLTLAVLDRLSACRTVAEYAAALQEILQGLYPDTATVTIFDPNPDATDPLTALASRSFLTGQQTFGLGAIAVVGTDGTSPQVALAVAADGDAATLNDIAHIAGRLLPSVRAVAGLRTPASDTESPVLDRIRGLERAARAEDQHLVVAVVDISVDPALSASEAEQERGHLSHRLRRLLRPQDRVWTWGERLVVVQVLPEPSAALMVERLVAGVRAVHAESGVSRRLVDSWAAARASGEDVAEGLVERAVEGLERMAQLRDAGHAVLQGQPLSVAFAGFGDTDAVVVVDAQRMIRGINQVGLTMFSELTLVDLGDSVDTDDLTFHHPDGAVLVDDELPGLFAMKTGMSVQDRLIGVRYRDFPMHWALITAVGINDVAGRARGYVASLTPVGGQVREDRLRDAIDLVREPLVLLSPLRTDNEISDFAVRQVNTAALRALNLSEDRVVGAAEGDLHPEDDRLGLVLDYAAVVTTGQAARKVLAIPDGSLTGSIEVTAEPCGDGVLVVAHSLASGSRRGELAKLWDGLTGLSSRLGLLHRLEELQRAAESPVTLVMVDIDDFTGVNDELGRLRSDRYLVEVGRLLSQMAAPHDLVARMGSDEFAFLTTSADSIAAATDFAESVRRALKAGVSVGDRRLTAASSLGLAWSAPGGRATELLSIADVALYRSKAAGGDCVTLGRNRQVRIGVVEMESGLRTALDEGELVLHFQPVVSLLDTTSVSSVEALLRWQHPERGLVSPGEFIPVAERRHLIVEIGEWVVTQACEQARRWRDELGFSPRISVNVSTGQLVRQGLAAVIEARTAAAGIDPSWLQLEITESQLLSADQTTLGHLWACREVGCELAIDDFGTGHAGFDYLRRIPAQVLKIDKTFIDGLGVDTTDTAIVSGVIAVGHGMGLAVVAEGVERQAQAEVLRGLGCDAGQGWLWSRALPAAELAEVLRAGM